MPPIRILHSVASGILGREAALAGGVPTAALGLLLHFLVAMLAATGFYFLYCVLYRVVPQVCQWPSTAGLIYGAGFYFVMTFFVVPLSRARTFPFNAVDLLGHIVLIGLPIGVIIGKVMRSHSPIP